MAPTTTSESRAAGHHSLKLAEPGRYKHIAVKPATLALGAFISGVDLSEPCEQDVYDEIADALWRHHVLFFRDQAWSPEGHLALARCLGEPEVHEIFAADEAFPEISILENDADRPPEINTWHSDTTFRAKPSLCTVLWCETVPPAGGDTMWLNQQLAFEELSPPLQELALGLEAQHDILNYYAGTEMLEGAGGAEKAAELRNSHPVITHPAVIAHPVTGKPCLLVNPTHTRRLAGLRKLESDRLLQLFYDHLQTPEFAVRFRWEPGSIAIWDNLATQHYALADYYPMHRRMRRVTVGGPEIAAYRPPGAAAAPKYGAA